MNREMESIESEERQVTKEVEALSSKQYKFHNQQLDKDDFFSFTNRLLIGLDALELSSKDREEALEIQLEYQELEHIVARSYEAYEEKLKKEKNVLELRLEELQKEKRYKLLTEDMEQDKQNGEKIDG